MAKLQFFGNPSIGLDNNLTANATLKGVQGGHALVAVFTPLSYDINVNSTSGGKRSSRPATPGPYPFDGNYSLSATANHGYSFSGWTGDANSIALLTSTNANIAPFKLTHPGNLSFTANFTENQYLLTVEYGAEASASPSLQSNYNHSDLVPITATALHGYQFDEWTEANGSLGSLDNYTQLNATVDMSHRASDIKVTALFKPLEYPVNPDCRCRQAGNDQPNVRPMEALQRLSILATPAPSCSFAGWTGDANSTNSLTNGASDANNSLAIVGPVTLAANFALILISLSSSHRRIGKWKHSRKRIVQNQRYSSSHRHTEPRMAFHEIGPATLSP